MPKTPDQTPDPTPAPSTFASRAAERAAREAAGEVPPPRRQTTFRAGINADNPLMVVTHVQA